MTGDESLRREFRLEILKKAIVEIEFQKYSFPDHFGNNFNFASANILNTSVVVT